MDHALLYGFPQFLSQMVDILYKISLIITLFYATKAIRIYIDKNSYNR
jgi:hypothetical protein